MIKGQNIGFFIKRVRTHIKMKLSDLSVEYIMKHDRIFIDYNEIYEKDIISRLMMIPGIFDFAVAHVTEPNLEKIVQTAIHVLDLEIDRDHIPFKIETRRSDKSFPMTSLEVTKHVADLILKGTKWKFVVDVKNPEEILRIELRKDQCYIYLKMIKGMGGYPFGTGGKGLLMMSGGIDSPVAGYLAMKQGIDIELFHFESTPLTPIESVQKVIDLAKILANYTPNDSIKLHLVPFFNLHEKILATVYDPYIITVMRRMMYRIAERFTKHNKSLCIINGDAVGQVASQTIQSMKVVESVTQIPILRPLVTYDKLDIIKLATHIQTFDISTRPFNDCCSVYVPKRPVTKPMEVYATKYENEIDYMHMIEDILSRILTLDITSSSKLNIGDYGLSTSQAVNQYQKEMSLTNDHIETE